MTRGAVCLVLLLAAVAAQAETVRLTARAGTDVTLPGICDSTTFQRWTQTSGPTVALDGLQRNPTVRVPAVATVVVFREFCWTGLTLNFVEITVVVEPLGLPASLPRQEWRVGGSVSLTLPEATGGVGAISYTLAPVPAGLTFDPATRTIAGIPSERGGNFNLTYTAIDARGFYAKLKIPVSVAAGNRPVFTATVPDQTYVGGASIQPLQIPAAGGGDGALTYSVFRAVVLNTVIGGLPAGLEFDPATRRITGTPSVTDADGFPVTILVRDADNDEDRVSFKIFVEADSMPVFGGAAVGDQVYRARREIEALMLPAVTGGNPPLTWSIAGLPAGLEADFAAGEIRGAPLAAAPPAPVTLTVTDRDGDRATATFSVEVRVNAVPAFAVAPAFTAELEARRYHQHDPIEPVVLPEASGGDGALSYRLAGPPPAGLTLDAGARTLTGSPAAAGRHEVVWIAEDGDGDTGEYRFVMDVARDLEPVFPVHRYNVVRCRQGGQELSVCIVRGTRGVAIEPMVFVPASGGDPPLRYEIGRFGTESGGAREFYERPLPPGLRFDPEALTITGTPALTAFFDAGWSVRVTDADGDAAHLLFILYIAAAGEPAFVESIPDQHYRAGAAIAPLVLPRPVDTDGTEAYRIVPALPEGLEFDEAGHRITGVPERAQERGAWVLIASDGDADVATLSFAITVAPNRAPAFDRDAPLELAFTMGTVVHTALPRARGGDPPLSYRVSPAAPAGLAFTAGVTGGVGIVGTAGAASSGRYTLTAVDADGDEAELAFDLTVVGSAPAFAAAAREAGWIAGSPIAAGAEAAAFTEWVQEPLELPRAAGGMPPYHYRVEPPLAAGLTFDAQRLVVAGRPAAALARTTYALIATDGGGAEARYDFAVTVDADDQPEFGTLPDAPDATYSTSPCGVLSFGDGGSFSVVFPPVTGGNGELKARIVPHLRPGLTFDRAAWRVEGAIVDRTGAYATYVTVTDEDGDQAECKITLLTFVVGNNPPRFEDPDTERYTNRLPDLTFRQDRPVDHVLWEAKLGQPPYRYYLAVSSGISAPLEEGLPAGLTFDGSTRRISGVPRAPTPAIDYTYTAVDQRGAASSAAIAIRVEAELTPAFQESVADLILTRGVPASVTLPAATAGNGELTYELSPAPPAGLSFDGGTRQIAGTPSEAAARQEYTLTAADGDGDRGMLKLGVTVVAAEGAALSFGAVELPARRYREFSPIPTLILPAAAGGAGTVTYTLEPAPPAGLTFDPQARRLAGTPLVAAPAKDYTFTATDQAGATASLAFTIVVDVDSAPRFAEPPPDRHYRWLQSSPLEEAVTLPEVTGGDGALTYEITPKLPAGLTFDPATRAISGTPDTPMGRRAYEFRVTDEDGDRIAAGFEITIVEDLYPKYDRPQLYVRTFRHGVPIPTWALDRASPGNGGLTYTVGPLPPGLVFDAERVELSGTPQVATGTSSTGFRVTATDDDGDQAIQDIYLFIGDNEVPRFADPAWDGSTRGVAGSPIEPLLLPALSGGDEPLRHVFEPPLPARLTHDEAGGRITGSVGEGITVDDRRFVADEPPEHTRYRYTVIDADGDEAQIAFGITIEPDAWPTYLAFIDTWVRRMKRDVPVTWVGASPSGGNGALTFTIDGLPDGLRFDAASTTISGTPTREGTFDVRLELTDEDGDVSQYSDEVYVLDYQPLRFSEQVPDQQYSRNSPITPLTLPEAAGGRLRRYSLRPSLPPGLSFDARTRRIIGTPQVAAAAHDYRLVAREDDPDLDDGSEAELVFSIAVDTGNVGGSAPRFDEPVASQHYVAGEPIPPLHLPAAAGGDGALTYAVAGPLPFHLVFDPASRRITGTPYVPGRWTGALTATDADGDLAAVDLLITVTGGEAPRPRFPAVQIPDRRYVEGSPIAPLVLPAAGVSDGSALTYTLHPGPPAGLTFDAATRTLTGIPAAPGARPYTVVAATADGRRDSLAFVIEVIADTQPAFAYEIGALRYRTGEAIPELLLPHVDGGNEPVRSEFFGPALPAGLTRDRIGGRVSGTPTELTPPRTYRLVATDADGDRAELSFSLEVSIDAMPAFAAEVPEQRYTQGRSVVDLELPTATGGDGLLSYRLDPPPPAGLAFDPARVRITGTPRVAAARRSVTLTATDADGDTAHVAFAVTVEAADGRAWGLSFGAAAAPALSFTQGKAVDVELPAANGGHAAVVYRIEPALPLGLQLRSAAGALAGEPVAAQPAKPYTLIASDGFSEAHLGLTIAVAAADTWPKFAGSDVSGPNVQSYEDVYLIQNQPMLRQMPYGVGGNEPLRYNYDYHILGGELPDGLHFDRATHRLSGTPTRVGTGALEIAVIDADGDWSGRSWAIVVEDDGIPDFDGSVADQRYTEGAAIEPLTLPAATGGNGGLSYRLVPAPPAGLTLDPIQRRLEGTPTAATPERLYAWQAEDIEGDRQSLYFRMQVVPVAADDLVPRFSATVPDQRYVQHTAIEPLALPAASGGDGALSYALTPALRAGLNFDAASRNLYGTPTEVREAATWTLSATDADGDRAELAFSVSVIPDPTPSFQEQVDDQHYTENRPIAALTLPAAVGGTGELGYALTPAPPAGLSFAATTRVLSGTPRAPLAETPFTLTATDANGVSASLGFHVTVAEDLEPSFGASAVADQSWTRYRTIEPLTLPAAVGGDGPLTYTLTPTLPSGLRFDPADRRISGAPEVTGAPKTFTLTATDGDGDEAELSFVVTVGEPRGPLLSVSPVGVLEGNAPRDIQVAVTVRFYPEAVLTVPTEVAVTVEDDTATVGEDYAAVTPFTLTIAAGQSSATQTITMRVLGDEVDEAAQELAVFKGEASGGYTGAVPGDLASNFGYYWSGWRWPLNRLAFYDDDLGGFVLDGPEEAVTTEDGGNGGSERYTLRLGSDPPIEVRISVRSDTPSEAVATPETLTFTSENWNETRTVTVVGQDDAVADGDQSYTLSFSVSDDVLGDDYYVYEISGVNRDNDEASTEVLLTAAPAELAEDGTAQAVTVTGTLNAAASPEPIEVALVVADGTAVAPADYGWDGAAVTLTIAAAEAAGTAQVTITPVADDLDEEDESVLVGGTASGELTVLPATVRITDDDALPELSVGDVTVTEGAGGETTMAEFPVSLSPVSGREVTVAYATAEGTAAAAADYAAAIGTLTFAAGETERTLSVAVAGDDLNEAEEQFTVTLSAPTDGATELPLHATLTDGVATGTITDDDPLTAMVTADAETVAEGESASFPVAMSGGTSTAEVVVSYTVSGTAEADVDYKEPSGKLALAAGAASGTITIATLDEGVLDPGETLTVELNSATTDGRTVTVAGTGKTTIMDSGAVTVAVAGPAAVTEGETASFTVSLSGAVAEPVEVAYATEDGTAKSGAEGDYTAASGTLTFSPGALEQTIEVTTIDDELDEAAETFAVVLTAPNLPAGVSVETARAEAAITDGDPLPELTIGDVTVTEGADGETTGAEFTVSLSPVSGREVTVAWATADGTAASPGDYAEASGTLTFAAGETERTLSVAVAGDDLNEADETFTVSLSAPTDGETELPLYARLTESGGTATGTITDDDDPPELTIADVTVSEGTGGGTTNAEFTVNLSAASGLDVTVGYATAEGTAESGADNDYEEASGTLTFSPGERQQSVTVAIHRDELNEAEEEFTLTLSGAANATLAGGNSELAATGTITDDDELTAAVSADAASVAEGDSASFTVELSGGTSTAEVVVSYTVDGTAVANSDYTAPSGALTLAAGAASGTIAIQTLADAELDPDETLEVTLSGASTAGAVQVAAELAQTTITDDDTATVTIEAASATEGESLAFTVRLTKAVQGGVTVTPSFTDGTASDGTDYTANAAALSFVGTLDETKTITVSTTEDEVVEGAETFTVSLSVSEAPSGVTAGTEATGTITDDDTATVTIEAASAAEGESLAFTVRLSKAVQGGLTVTPSFSDVTTTEGTDYTANAAALSFVGTLDETKTITVSTTEDEVVEGAETFTVGLSVTEAPSGVTAGAEATGTITDDDTATVTIEAASATEGEPLAFTVRLTKAVQGGVTVTPSFSDRTATAGTDYTTNTTALSFTGTLDETKTIAVSTTEDEVVEGDETFTVSLAVTGAPSGVTAGAAATGTITDDDSGSAVVTIAAADAAEGESLTFTVRLSRAVQGGLTVTPSFTNGTATADVDYTADTTALSFTGTLDETKTITVSTTEDDVVEVTRRSR